MCGVLKNHHSLMIVNKDQLLKRWIVFLSILCFSLSIIGTFLVRSGILTSVHAFATDSSRGIFMLLLFLIVTGFSFLLFIVKSPEKKGKLKIRRHKNIIDTPYCVFEGYTFERIICH